MLKIVDTHENKVVQEFPDMAAASGWMLITTLDDVYSGKPMCYDLRDESGKVLMKTSSFSAYQGCVDHDHR